MTRGYRDATEDILFVDMRMALEKSVKEKLSKLFGSAPLTLFRHKKTTDSRIESSK